MNNAEEPNNQNSYVYNNDFTVVSHAHNEV